MKLVLYEHAYIKDIKRMYETGVCKIIMQKWPRAIQSKRGSTKLQNQQESTALLHDHTARVLLLGLGIECLALHTQIIRLGHQAVKLLASLQYRFDRLV